MRVGIAAGCRAEGSARGTLSIGSVLLMLIAVGALACTSPNVTPSDTGPDAWPLHRTSREGPGEKIGEIALTDPTGGPPRAASIGTHGIRIVLDIEAGGAEEGGTVGAAGVAESDSAAESDSETDAPVEVRVIYSRQGAADTRAFVAVADPEEAGVYLGTVDLGAAGEWRIRVRIVGGGGGSAQITVPGR